MKAQLFRSIFAPIQKATQFVAGLSVAVSLMALNSPVQAAQKPITNLPNGVYLYGQSAQSEQIGQAYFVFEVRQGKLVGALFMPRSSFDCTYGSIQADKLALTVVNSYEKGATNPYAIALERSNVAGNPGASQIGLEGFQRINKVSANDKRILNTCKASYQNRVWK
jgi:hypothetical protein